MVNAALGAAAKANVQVSVNALPVAITVGGRFSASVDVKAQAAITVRAGDSSGLTDVISIPTSAIPAGGTPSDALVQLNADAVTLMLPPDGFTIVDGVAIRASIHVAGIAGIAHLELNGVNLLARLRVGSSSGNSGTSSASGNAGSSGKPGGASPPNGWGKSKHRHTASATVSGKANNVTVTVTGTNGASQTTIVPVRRVRTVIRLGRQLSVSAFGARGIRIAAVRFNTSAVAHTGRLAVTVTVRDRRHYLIRDAVVMLQPFPHRASISGSWARMTSVFGRATFTVPVAAKALGHRLYLDVLARTPLTSTHILASVYLAGAVR